MRVTLAILYGMTVRVCIIDRNTTISGAETAGSSPKPGGVDGRYGTLVSQLGIGPCSCPSVAVCSWLSGRVSVTEPES